MASQVNFGVSADPGSNTDNTDTPATGSSIFGFSPNEANAKVPWAQRPPGTENVMGPVAGPPGGIAFSDAMGHYATLHATDPKGFASFQEQLYRSGYYDKYLKNGEQPKLGVWDATTRKAAHDMLADSVASGQTPEETMAESAQANGGQGGQQKKQAAPPRLTNPADVKASVDQESRQVLGQPADQALQDQVAGNFEQMAQQPYNADVAAGDNASPQYYRTSASQAWIDAQLRSLRPQTAQAFQTSTNIGQFLKMVDSQGQFSAYHQ